MSILRGYYTLIGSLPHLPAPERAERSPINRQRLEQRFRALEPEETRVLGLAADLLLWERTASFESDAEVVERYDELLKAVPHAGARAFLENWMEVRTVLAALRRQRRGDDAPSRDEVWGIDPRALWIERHWDRLDFGLGSVHPWISEAREHLDAGRAEELQLLLTRLAWRRLCRIAEPDPFGFDAVFAYGLKWHLLERWLSRDPAAAAVRFRGLVDEVCHELQ